LLTGTLGLAWAFLRAGPVAAVDLLVQPTLTGAASFGQQPPAPATPPAEKHSRQLVSQFLYRDRPQQILLSRARQELADGNTGDGLQHLQEVINQPHDAFLFTEKETRPVGARSEAARILESLDVRGLSSYEHLYGPEAKALLKAARESGDPRLVADVSRRF